MPDLNASPHKPADFHPLRSLARLTLGGLWEGAAILVHHLRQWEQDLDTGRLGTSGSQPLDAETQPVNLDFDPLPQQLPPPDRRSMPIQTPPAVPQAALGLTLSVLEHLVGGTTDLGRQRRRAERRLVRLAGGWPRTTGLTRLAAGFDRLAARGERQVAAWTARGQAEIDHSRRLVQQAVETTTETLIESLTQNPEVKELVQSQSVGLAAEVVEEVRERTVSADTFLEGLVRSVLRRKPRQQLPPPPPEVRQLAERLRQTGKPQ